MSQRELFTTFPKYNPEENNSVNIINTQTNNITIDKIGTVYNLLYEFLKKYRYIPSFVYPRLKKYDTDMLYYADMLYYTEMLYNTILDTTTSDEKKIDLIVQYFKKYKMLPGIFHDYLNNTIDIGNNTKITIGSAIDSKLNNEQKGGRRKKKSLRKKVSSL